MLKFVEKHDHKYGIFDTEDNSYEYLSRKEVLKLIKLGYNIVGLGNKAEVDRGVVNSIVRQFALGGSAKIDGCMYCMEGGKIVLQKIDAEVIKNGILIIPPFVNKVRSFIFDNYLYYNYKSIKIIGGNGLDSCVGLFEKSTFTDIDLSQFNPMNCYSLERMFKGCWRLNKVKLSGMYIPELWAVREMFRDCTALEEVDFSGLDCRGVVGASSLFYGCESLRVVNFGKFGVKTAIFNHSNMFVACYKVNEIIVDRDSSPILFELLESFSDNHDLELKVV